MKYTLTCLTPLLVGDGQKLSPIDYMVWKDQVNVLDQRRIFKLLSKGPRLDNYLAQIKRAEKLDFASWGGFAQNFAGRRIPFEHSSSTQVWEQARAESLHIPTFCAGPNGPYLPGSAVKGALRTALAFSRATSGMTEQIGQRLQGADRPMRSPGEMLDHAAVGSNATSRTRAVAAGDSSTIPQSAFRVYLLRTATLVARGQTLELGWKVSPRGSASGTRPLESTPAFAEMAAPGTTVEGPWEDRAFFTTPEIARELGWKSSFGPDQILAAANDHAAALLAVQKRYADQTRLAGLQRSLEALESRLAEVRRQKRSCMLCLGWGGGFLTKSALLDTGIEAARGILRMAPEYQRAIQTGLPFPKTRRIVFLDGQPATLPGWALLEVGSE